MDPTIIAFKKKEENMPAEVMIKVHQKWLEDEEALMWRLKQIISGDGYGPYKKDSGYAWQLDASNDWWAEIRNGTLIVAYRYGESDKFKTLVPYLREYLK